MKINIKRVAELANLPISKDEERKFEEQLSAILDYFKKLEEVNVKSIQETSQVTGLENITRDDVSKPSLSQDEGLQNTKSKHNGLFKVKAILDGE